MSFLICLCIYGKGVKNMRVLIIKLTPFSTTTLENVTDILFANNTYTIEYGANQFVTYDANDYKISILF